MNKLALMTVFIAIVEEGSFTQAAKRLGKTKALLSTQLSQLESALGVRLINRSTRSLNITAAGQHYYSKAKQLLNEIAQLESELVASSDRCRGLLRISIPTTFGEQVLMPFMADLLEQSPDLHLEIALHDHYVDLIGSGFDAAIRIGALEDSSMIAKSLGETPVILCAVPAFLAHHGPINHFDDLQHLPCIVDTNYRQGNGWFLNKTLSLAPKSRIKVNSAFAAAELAKTGAGVAYCPRFAVKEALNEGSLVSVLTELTDLRLSIHLVYPHRQYVSSNVSLLGEHLRKYLSATLV